MADLILRRRVARVMMSVGCLVIFTGVALMAFDHPFVGDGILVAGFIGLIIGTGLLATTPTEDQDAG